MFVRNVLGSSTFEQIDFVSFLQQNEYLAILKVQYETHGIYTQRSFLRIRDSLFLEGIQLIFSHSTSYIHVTLENLSISHTANGAPNITGSTHALYTLILRNVSFVENVYIVDNLFNRNVEMVNLSHAQRVTFID